MTLVIMAAGMGSRFGGLKQIEPINSSGEFIIDYSVYDAIKAGFDKVVFIIRKDNYEIFRNTIGKRIEKLIHVDYVFQESDNIEGIPQERTKPGKFFNILDEQEKQPSKSEEPMFDFNKMFINPVEQQPFNSNNALLDELNEIENSINNSKIIKPLEQPEEELEEEPKIEMPKQDETDDDLEFIEEFEDEDTIEQAPKTEEITEQEPILEKQIIIPETTITSFKDVLQLIRECSEKIEDAGYKIDTEEIDLDDIYQVIFKINK